MSFFERHSNNAVSSYPRNTGAGAATLENALDGVSRLDDLLVKTDKAATLNKNEYNLSAVEVLTQCRAAILSAVKAPSAGIAPSEPDHQDMEQSAPRFGK